MATLALGMVLILTGCGTVHAADGGASTPAETRQVADSPAAPSVGAVTDAETCEAMGDVITITFNVDAAVREGRMADQERDGWYRLATRVLYTVPTRGEGAVSDAVVALQAVVPSVKLGAAGRSEIDSGAWRTGLPAVYRSCDDAGTVLLTEGFTGG